MRLAGTAASITAREASCWCEFGLMSFSSNAEPDVTVHVHSSSGIMGDDKYLQTAADDMQLQLQQYGSNLTSFANGMSELNRINEDPHPKFIEMRNKVNQLAVWYVGGPFQNAISVVQDLTTYAETYTSLDLDTFCSEISAVADMVAEYKQKVVAVAEEHLKAERESKQLARDAAAATEELNNEVKVHEQLAKELAAKAQHHAEKEAEADSERDTRDDIGAVAFVVAGAATAIAVPPVATAAFVAGMLNYSVAAIKGGVAYYHDMQQEKAQVKLQGNLKQDQDARDAVQLIEGRLLPYINNFSAALQQLSNCFSVLASDVERFGSAAEQSKQSAENSSRMRLHFLQMRGIAKDLIRSCKSLSAETSRAREELKTLSQA